MKLYQNDFLVFFLIQFVLKNLKTDFGCTSQLNNVMNVYNFGGDDPWGLLTDFNELIF